MESDELNLLEQIGKCEERCVFWEKKIKAHKESLKNFNQRNLELGRQHAHIDQQVKECQQLQQQVAELEKRVLATQTGTNERRLNGPEPEQLSIFRRRWQSEPEAVRRSLDIYGTLRDLARVANSRLANMLSAHLGGQMNLLIVKDGRTRDWIWHEYPRITVGVLDNIGIPGEWKESITPEGLMRFALGKDRKSFYPGGKQGNVFPHAVQGCQIQPDMQCFFAVNAIFLPADCARWRPFLYKILGPTLIFHSSARAKEYLDRLGDTPQTILTLDEDIPLSAGGGDKYTPISQSHRILQNWQPKSAGFPAVESADRLSDQQLSMTEEGKQLLGSCRLVKSWAALQAKRDEVRGQIQDLAEQKNEEEKDNQLTQEKLELERSLRSKLDHDLQHLQSQHL